jgi:hypothetical protein
LTRSRVPSVEALSQTISWSPGRSSAAIAGSERETSSADS